MQCNVELDQHVRAFLLASFGGQELTRCSGPGAGAGASHASGQQWAITGPGGNFVDQMHWNALMSCALAALILCRWRTSTGGHSVVSSEMGGLNSITLWLDLKKESPDFKAKINSPKVCNVHDSSPIDTARTRPPVLAVAIIPRRRRLVPHQVLKVRHDLALVAQQGEGRQDVANVPPPRLAKLPVPAHRRPQPGLNARPLPPPQLPELGVVDGVAPVVVRPVVRVLYPPPELVRRAVVDGHGREEQAAEGEVGDLVVGAHVVDLAQLALVQNRVEGVGCVAGVEVASCRAAVAVEDDGLASMKKTGKLGYDFCACLVHHTW